MAESKTQVGKGNNGKFVGQYVVVPRTNEGYKELYAKAGQKTILFGQPYQLTEQDILNLNNQKEAVRPTGSKTPYDLSREKGISIDEAVKLLDKMGDTVNPEQLTWLPKYDLHKA